MSGTDDVILIRAQSKQNSLTSLVVGVAGALVALILLTLFAEYLFLAGIFVLSASIVALLIAWYKWREPTHSMSLTRDQIAYHHRNGQWTLNWNNIQRIDVPKIQVGLDLTELGLVGIRIKDYMPLIENISPRLATNILLEQRPLLLQFQKQGCTSGNCYSEDLIEDDIYKLEDGRVVRGVKGMLANRMKKLRERLGYDIFIAAAELDRSEQDFVSLLRQCQQQVIRQG